MRSALRTALFAVLLSCSKDNSHVLAPTIPIVRVAPASPSEPVPTGRLPKDVRPSRYQLSLEIVPERERFAGEVAIDIALAAPRQTLWLHGEVKPKRAFVQLPHGRQLQLTWKHHDHGVLSLEAPEVLSPGKATLRIDFESDFSTRGDGLYRISRGEDKYAFTQFEAIAARRAFPCFDEPGWKTPFDITLFVKKGDRAVANTKEIARAEAPLGLERVNFATTEPLPTYLVAFAVGPLDVVDAEDVPPNNVRSKPLPFRGVTTRGRGKELAYALQNTGTILGLLENYFGIAYPYDKLDVVAVPEKAGAMENAGLVTFSEWLLLLNEAGAPIQQKRAFAGVMAHELAHQWFGNLVTMDYWDDLWLNEAFATWMANRIVEQWKPEYRVSAVQFSKTLEAMDLDSLLSARQIRQTIGSNHDIHNAFDPITYRKGGTVLGMFERWLGADAFRRGVHAYLEKHRFGTSTMDDLLNSLSETAKRDARTPFKTFLEQPGVPLLDIKVSCGETRSVTVRQTRYAPLGSGVSSDQGFQVPACFRYPDGKGIKETCALIVEKEQSVPLETRSCPAWVHPNSNGSGYFRFALEPSRLRALLSEGYKNLSPLEKMSLIDSVHTGFNRGVITADEALSAFRIFAMDSDRDAAGLALPFYRELIDWVSGTPEEAKARGNLRDLLSETVRSLGGFAKTANEPLDRKLYRETVFEFAALVARDPRLRKAAAEAGRKYIGFGTDDAFHPELVDANLASTALAVAAQEVGEPFVDVIIKRLDTTRDETVRTQLLGALSALVDPKLSERARDTLLTASVRPNEVAVVLERQFLQPETRSAAWTWFGGHVGKLIEKLPPGRAGGLPLLASRLCDKKYSQELNQWFAPISASIEGAPRNLAEAYESIELCAFRKEKNFESLLKHFKVK